VASEVLWSVGAVATIALAFTIVSRLLRGKVDAGHAVPAWLIPGVATLDITVAGSAMPMAWARELNLFSMAVGTMIALVFFTMIVSRLIHHHEKLANEMVPSLMILMAPVRSRLSGVHELLPAGRCLRGHAFLLSGCSSSLALAFKVFKRSVPFAAGWWALSFPIAALVNAALRYAEHAGNAAVTALAVVLLAFLSVLIAVLLFRTLRLFVSGRLLAPR
jgi:tellurite resistance protein